MDIYIDGPNINQLKQFKKKKNISGFTYNPTLISKLTKKNYLNYCKNLSELAYPKSISLEVIADNEKDMINQALKLSKIKKNVVVKIPITFTNGTYTTSVIDKLILNKVKLNITAVFNLIQVKKIYRVIKKSDIIISVFAGRIHDMGVDAEKEINKINNFLRKNKSKARVLWASTRQVYDFKQAKNSKCSIITMSPGIYDKLKFLNYGWKKFSLDTVKQFFYDASKSKFKI